MKGSYSVPTGISRSPKMLSDRPKAERVRNRFISAMPSSRCWPAGPASQRKAEGIFSSRNRSRRASRAKRPRRPTQAPRLVETVTSGLVVTMRSAIGASDFASACISRPKPAWVEVFAAGSMAMRSGTGRRGAVVRRGPRALKGTRPRKPRSAFSGTSSPSAMSHSWPGRMPMAARQRSICCGFSRPAWLSLCPASGRPEPLMV